MQKNRINTASFCSHKCVSLWNKKNIPKGKITISTQGYAFIKLHGHPRGNRQNYVKRANLVMEKKIGRVVKKNEVVHHIDGDRLNDCPDNLEVMTKREHDRMETTSRWKYGEIRKQQLEKPKIKVMYEVNCAYCDKDFLVWHYRIIRSIKLHCSKKCAINSRRLA